jgi:hypothetical protein
MPSGIAPDAPLLKIYGSLYIQSGVAGTWGPGHNALSVVHIKDVGTAFVKIFKLALEGKAKDVDCEPIPSPTVIVLS